MWVASSFATTSNPLVSLSIRWTMPGRIYRRCPRLPCSARAGRSPACRPGCPGAGWTTHPLGACSPPEDGRPHTRCPAGCPAARPRWALRRDLQQDGISRLELEALGDAPAVAEHMALGHEALQRAAGKPVSSPLRKRSMRWPAASASTINSRCSMFQRSFEGLSSTSSSRMTSTQSATPTQTQMSAKLKTAKSMNRGLM